MYKITVWSRRSTNFDKNWFVKEFGTDTVEVESRTEAVGIFQNMISDSFTDKAVMDHPLGTLSWERRQKPQPEDCDNCREDGCSGA